MEILDLDRVIRHKKKHAWKILWKTLFDKELVNFSSTTKTEAEALKKANLKKAVRWGKNSDHGWFLNKFCAFVCWRKKIVIETDTENETETDAPQ